MTQEQQKRLTSYLNELCLRLTEKDQFLLTNTKALIKMCIQYSELLKSYNLSNENITNNLTFEDVYQLGREIIEKVNPNWLTKYKQLIKSGELDFIYDETGNTKFQRENKYVGLINIKRAFNYGDVWKLIHEFIHYINDEKCQTSSSRYYLTEFLSIYFERYSIEYLINEKGVLTKELNYNSRINQMQHITENFLFYIVPFIAFNEFGSINEDTVSLVNDYICDTTKEEFNHKCLKMLKYFDYIKDECQTEMFGQNSQIKIDDLIWEKVRGIVTSYRYIIGTFCAYYAYENCEMQKIVYFNDHISDLALENLNSICLLKRNGIDLNSDVFFNQSIIATKKYINRHNHVRR